MAQDEAPRRVYVLIEGRPIRSRDDDPVATIDAPDVVGELDVLLSRPPPTSCTVAEAARILHVDGDTYLDIVAAHMPVGGALVASFDEL